MNRNAKSTKRWRRSLGLLATVVTMCGVVSMGGFVPPPDQGQPAKPAAPAKPDDKKTEVASDPYPLETCIVSGEKLGSMGKPVVKEYDGREVRFCCNGCIKEFEAKQAEFIKKIDAKIIEQQLPHYPLKTCVVMTEDTLGEEGAPVNRVYKNRLVRFCCAQCPKEFEKEPAKYLKAIDEAVIKEQKPNYPMHVDVVTGQPLGANVIDKVYGVTLVRFNSQESVEKYNADPLPYLAKLREAWSAKQPH